MCQKRNKGAHDFLGTLGGTSRGCPQSPQPVFTASLIGIDRGRTTEIGDGVCVACLLICKPAEHVTAGQKAAVSVRLELDGFDEIGGDAVVFEAANAMRAATSLSSSNS